MMKSRSDSSWIKRSFAFFGVTLIAAAAYGQPQSIATPFGSLESKLSHLRSIEQTVLPPTIVEGPPAHESLADYFCATNPRLRSRLIDAREAFARPGSKPFRAMTIVAGPAGVGKTFIKGEVYADIPKDQRWKFDVRELFDEFKESGLAELKPDLCCGDRVFNRLLTLTEQGRHAFQSHLNTHGAPFIVVDSIDEVHPDDYEFVIKELEHAALDTDRAFAHLVIFGRPLAFRDYWLECAKKGQRAELQGFMLEKPNFQTTGDLAVSNWNYDCWKHSLHRVSGEKTTPFPFSDYLRWAENRYAKQGEFSDVAHSENIHITPEARDLLFRWVGEHRIVASVLSNLAANEMVRDISASHHANAMDYDERKFMDEFLAKWLERDTKSDDRPSRRKPAYLAEYQQLLEAVAAMTLREGRVDPRGYFSVPDDWVITPSNCETPVAVIQILNRSGLVSVDPNDPLSQRFRFEPFWFHRLLVERFLEGGKDRIETAQNTNSILPKS